MATGKKKPIVKLKDSQKYVSGRVVPGELNQEMKQLAKRVKK